jgi:hypothetical protein
MEYMPPPTLTKSGWKTLYSFRKGRPDLDPKLCEAIAKKLKELLKALSDATFVHGDLRSNNIIIKVGVNGVPVTSEGGDVEIMAVDFDWAGASGYVTYPPGLNTNIKWKATSGEAIVTAHDTSMVQRWWEEEFGGCL